MLRSDSSAFLYHERPVLCIINPFCRFRLLWDVTSMFCLFYCLLVVPVRIGWDWSEPINSPLFAVETAIDFFFVVDIFMNFRTGIVLPPNSSLLQTSNGRKISKRQVGNSQAYVSDGSVIARHYLHTWFLVDFISSIPLDFIMTVAATGDAAQVDSMKMVRILRLTKLMKLLRVLKINKFLDNMMDHYPINEGIWRGAHMLVICVYVAHLLACFFFYTGNCPDDATNSTVAITSVCDEPDGTWISNYGIEGHSRASQYLSSLYWAFTTVTTVGYGDITPQNDTERSYEIFAMVVGASLFGYMIGNVSDSIANANAANAIVTSKMQQLNQYMVSRRLPHDLQVEIRKYFRYYWQKKSVFDEQNILLDLSANLQNKLLLYLHKEMIANISLFQDRDQAFVSLVVRSMKPLFFMPQETIVREGEQGDDMFFLVKGVVRVCSIHRYGKRSSEGVGEGADKVGCGEKEKEKKWPGITYATLRDGDYFGEIALLRDLSVSGEDLGANEIKANQRTATCIAQKYCDLYSVTRDTLTLCLAEFEDVRNTVSKEAERRVMQIVRKRRALKLRLHGGGGTPGLEHGHGEHGHGEDEHGEDEHGEGGEGREVQSGVGLNAKVYDVKMLEKNLEGNEFELECRYLQLAQYSLLHGQRARAENLLKSALELLQDGPESKDLFKTSAHVTRASVKLGQFYQNQKTGVADSRQDETVDFTTNPIVKRISMLGASKVAGATI